MKTKKKSHFWRICRSFTFTLCAIEVPPGLHPTGFWKCTYFLHFLQEFVIVNEQISTEVVFADDFTVTRKVDEIKSY